MSFWLRDQLLTPQSAVFAVHHLLWHSTDFLQHNVLNVIYFGKFYVYASVHRFSLSLSLYIYIYISVCVCV
jgi:hypothetical protein